MRSCGAGRSRASQVGLAWAGTSWTEACRASRQGIANTASTIVQSSRRGRTGRFHHARMAAQLVWSRQQPARAVPERPLGEAPWAGSAPSAPRTHQRLCLLYAFAFWSQFKPSEPFLVEYLVDSKGLNKHEVSESVFALYTYLRLPAVALTGLLSELVPRVGSRGVLIGGAACGLATVVFTRFSSTLLGQQVAQFTIAASFASHFATPAVALAVAPEPSEFQGAVHMLKAVLLLSNAASALLGELLRDIKLPLDLLFDVSLAGQMLALLFAVLLPAQRRNQALAEVSEVQRSNISAVEPAGSRTTRCWTLEAKSAFEDILLSFRLRTVACWTFWALAMNPVHQFTMTYWQSLLREKGDGAPNHNGYFLTGFYVMAAALTAALRHSALLRSAPLALAGATALAAGAALFAAASAPSELPFYGWFMAYLCVFEVATAVATFQTGFEVAQAVRSAAAPAGHCDHTGGTAQGSAPRAPHSARLTLLFSTTALLAGAVQSIAQRALSHWHTIGPRFRCLAAVLAGVAGMLALARLWPCGRARRERQPR